MDALERLLGRIDRRLVYLGLFVFTLMPLVAQWRLPGPVSPQARDLYDAVEAVPLDRVIVIGIDWDAGTQAESRPQMLALARHMIRRGVKFAMISIGYPQSPQLSQDVVEEAIRLEKERAAKQGGTVDIQYGRDFVNLGYKEFARPWLLAFTQDVHAQVKLDWKSRPLSETFMARVNRWGPQGEMVMFIDVTGSSTAEEWRPLLYPKGVKYGLACTAVMAPEQYPFLANKQVVGMLTGMKGAAEYEKLLGYEGSGTRNMPGQSFAHLYILFLLVLGNIATISGMLRQRRLRARRRKGAREGGGAPEGGPR